MRPAARRSGAPSARTYRHTARTVDAVKQRKPAANRRNDSRPAAAIEALLDRCRPAALPRHAPVTPPTEHAGAPELVQGGLIEDGVGRRRRRARRRGRRLRRCLRTSISITCSTCGSTNGEVGRRAARCSSCGSPMTSWWVSSIVTTPSGSGADLRERFARFGLELHSTRRRGSSSSGGSPPSVGGRGVSASPSRLTFSA